MSNNGYAPPARKLTMTETLAIEAAANSVAIAQARLRQVFLDMGLDSSKSYSFNRRDGTLVEVDGT